MLKKFLAVLAMFYAFASFAAVDVNTATAADLDSVKGIGPSLSSSILKERRKGPFKDWNDFIARVKGVGEKNAAEFSTGGMTVNGATFAGAPAKANKPAKAQVAQPAAATASPAATNKTIPSIVTKPEAAVPAATTEAAKPAAPAAKQ